MSNVEDIIPIDRDLAFAVWNTFTHMGNNAIKRGRTRSTAKTAALA